MEAQQTAQMEQAAIAAETAKYKADTQAAAQQYSSDNRRQAQEYNSEVGLEKEKIRTQKDIVLADEKAAQQG
jgi:hypothetical protein